MRRGRGSWWWAQIMRALIYLALAVVSVGFTLWLNSRYPLPIRTGILLVTWILGMLLFDIRVCSEPVEGEGS